MRTSPERPTHRPCFTPSRAAGFLLGLLVVTLAGAAEPVPCSIDFTQPATLEPLDSTLRFDRPQTRQTNWSVADVAEHVAHHDLDDLATLRVNLAMAQGGGNAGEAHHGEEHWRRHPNRVGLFLGGTSRETEDSFTIGLEYERRINERFGLGVIAEYATKGRELALAVPTFFWHPFEGFAMSVGPGLALESGEAEFLVRIGIGYEFELGGGWSLGPVVSFDWLPDGENAVVYGALLGFAF